MAGSLDSFRQSLEKKLSWRSLLDLRATKKPAIATFMATQLYVRNLRTFPTLPERGKNMRAETTTTKAAERKLNATGGTQQGQRPRFRVIALCSLGGARAAGSLCSALGE